MKEYSVYITPAALEDMESIYNYIAVELQSVYYASKQYDRISNAISSLGSMPERCPLFDKESAMTKKVSRIIATIMLVISVCFVWYALKHPERSFPWSNVITYSIYIIYLAVMIIMFIAPFKKQ